MTAATAARRPRAGRFLATVLFVTALTVSFASCTAQPEPPEPTPSLVAEYEAIDLVGMWRVLDAEGESADTWLRLDAGDLHLWRDCGPVLGSWQAGASIFAASIYGATGGCRTVEGWTEASWLTSAVSYERTDDGWQLLDASGEPVARLRIDGAPAAIGSVAEEYAQAPVVTDRTREHFTQTPSLPSTLTPATAADLLGRWVPTVRTPSKPDVIFSSSGEWAGSDGCNLGRGSWSLGPEGEFVASNGPSTLVWCEGAAVPHWVADARLLGFDRDTLVLLDADGSELGRLKRS